MALEFVGKIEIKSKGFSSTNTEATFEFKKFCQEPAVDALIKQLSAQDFFLNVASWYELLYTLADEKKAMKAHTWGTVEIALSSGFKFEVVLIRHSSSKVSSDNAEIVKADTLTLKRLSAIIALVSLNSLQKPITKDQAEILEGKVEGTKRLINALFEAYSPMPTFDNKVDYSARMKVYLCFVSGFDFLATTYPVVVAIVSVIRQAHYSLMELNKGMRANESVENRIYQSLGTKVFDHNGKQLTFLQYIKTTTLKNNGTILEYAVKIFNAHYLKLEKRVNNLLKNNKALAAEIKALIAGSGASSSDFSEANLEV